MLIKIFLIGMISLGVSYAQTSADLDYFYKQAQSQILPSLLVNNCQDNNPCDKLISQLSQKTDDGRIDIYIQLGFIDETPYKNEFSLSSALKYNLIDGLKNCGFKQNDEQMIMSVLETEIRITISDPAQQGFYNNTLSEKLYEKYSKNQIMQTLEGTEYFIYAGHSRFGLGMDFFPQKNLQSKKTIPIFKNDFIQELPQSIKGLSYISCSSHKHGTTTGAIKAAKARGIQFQQLTDAPIAINDMGQLIIESLLKI